METIYNWLGFAVFWVGLVAASLYSLLYGIAAMLRLRRRMIANRHPLWCWYEWTFLRKRIFARLRATHKSVWNPRYFRVFDHQPQPYRSYYCNLYGEVLVEIGWLAKHADWDWVEQRLTHAERVLVGKA